MPNDQFQRPNKCSITNDKKEKYDIYKRCLRFAVRTAKLTDKLPKKMSLIEYMRQLIRSSASVGANMEEADGALTKKDFINRVGIARREARESHYWLKLIQQIVSTEEDEIRYLIGESREIKLILSSIINKTRSNK